MDDIYFSDQLRVQYKPGTGDRLVVSLAGRARKRGGLQNSFERPVNEFYKIASAGSHNHVLFVQDFTNSWMNAEGLSDAICTAISDIVRSTGVRSVSTLGNSMGGTMALLLSKLTAIDTAVAIAPQYSVHPELVSQDRRWMQDRLRIRDFKFREVSELPTGRTKFTIVHGNSEIELLHAEKFAVAQNIASFILPGYDHDLASRLHGRGDLAEIVLPAIVGRSRRVRLAIEALGGFQRTH